MNVDNRNLENMKEEMKKFKEKLEKNKRNCYSSENDKAKKIRDSRLKEKTEMKLGFQKAKDKFAQTEKGGFRINLLEDSRNYIRKTNKIVAKIRAQSFHSKY